MALNIIADFFGLINASLFNTASILLVACFIIWEIPRSVKLISEEYTEGLYTEGGRVVDFSLFALGLISVGYYMIGNASKIVAFLKTPGITAFFLVVLVVITLIILLGFLKRFFGRLEGNSITVFLTHGLLDLMHTIFHICLALLFIPAVSHLLFGGMVS